MQQFNEFYLEVLQNQEILQYSQPLVTENGSETQIFTLTTDLDDGKVPSTMTGATATTTNLIQMPPGYNFKDDGSGNYVLTLQTKSVGSTAVPHENPPTIDLQQFLSSNIMHSMSSVPTSAIVSTIDSTISDMNSLKSIQSQSIAMNASEVTSYTFETKTNQTTKNYAIGREISETTTSTKQSVEGSLPSIRKCAGKETKGNGKVALKISNENIKQEPEQVILKMEQELDNLQNDEHAAVDSGDECNIDRECFDVTMNDIEVIDEIDIENERFNGFPKQIIKDAKLMIRGKQLVELMSKFYRLECDLCGDGK